MKRLNSTAKGRNRLRRQYASGRLALGAILAMTLLNQLLLHKGISYHFFLSAAAPYYLVWVCKTMGLPRGLCNMAACAAAMLNMGYGLCWWKSRLQRRWLTIALGMYSVDTLLLVIFTLTLLKNAASCLLEIMTHCFVVGCLVVGEHAGGRLNRYRAAKFLGIK